ncbi:MAG: hypothetical protein HY708_08250 [Ignavibacteriae bacterium]|nr:hypothetical protein [Ignavibacteriota bacterium]
MILCIGCREKPPLPPQLDELTFDTSYVQIFPSFGGFTEPEDVAIGNDQLLYVADTKANRVVMLNRAGQILSAKNMLQPLSIAQDSRLDLLVGGLIIATNGDTVGAIFRIHLVSSSSDSAHRLDVARIDTVWRELARPARRFPSITIFGDNTYLAVRTGPENVSFIDPDDRVLQFDRNDNFITPVPALTSRNGSGITDISSPTGIASFPGVRDFVLCQHNENSPNYGALWLRYESTPDFEGWLPRFDPSEPGENSDFVRLGRSLYQRPEAVAIDPARRDVFIADAGRDSVFKFNNRGVFKSESFGSAKSGGVMRKPTGLAFFERVLYVLDGETGHINRFRLTTDIPR